MPTVHIHDRPVGVEHAPYVIAELGVNHDGSPERALGLVRLAAEAGADAIKVQVFRAEMLMSRAARLAAYQEAAGERDPLEMLRRLELSWEGLAEVLGLAHEVGLHAIATVFSLELVEPAARLRSAAGRGFDAWKSASPDIIHRPLLEALGATGRPLIVSTGASTPEEVGRAVGWLGPVAGRLALLQCVSAYPTPPEQAALEGIAALAAAHPGLVIGYSDHTQGVGTGAEAVALGAAILEKHFTDDTSAAGPDHAASLGPAAFRRYADAARGWWESARSGRAGGTAQAGVRGAAAAPRKRLLEIERDVRAVSRQSIVTTRALPAGHVVRASDLTFKRPGTGLEPFRLAEVVGAALVLPAPADTPLTGAHLGS